MNRMHRYTSLGIALALAVAACGEGAAGELQQATAATASGRAPCPSPAEIETAIGYAVQQRPVAVDGCLWELTGEHANVMVSLMYQPAARAEQIFADIRRGVQGARGMEAQPDRLDVGEGGWGYTSRGRKHAAAVAQGRVYLAEIDHNIDESLALPGDAAVRIIQLGMRVAPGPGGGATASNAGGTAAPLDACTLATNAEVARAAEERPDIAQYWSAPVVSLGGSHCDYDGGSIRIYQGSGASASFASTLKAMGAENAPKTPVAGLGDRAYFLVPYTDDPYKRLGLLAVHAGPNVVQLIFDARGNEPIEATRPRLEALARVVLPRLP